MMDYDHNADYKILEKTIQTRSDERDMSHLFDVRAVFHALLDKLIYKSRCLDEIIFACVCICLWTLELNQVDIKITSNHLL